MADFPAGNKLHKYLNSVKYSDFSLWCGTEEIKAHKIILAEASDFFKTLFEGARSAALFKVEASEWPAIKGVIGWIYGYGETKFERIKPTVFLCDQAGSDYVQYQVDIYVVASKYLITGLQDAIAAKIRVNLAAMVHGPGLSLYIDQIARKVYQADGAEGLRTHVRQIFMKHREAEWQKRS